MKRGIRLLKFVLPVLAVTAAVLASCQKEPEYLKTATIDYNDGVIVVTKGAETIPAGARVEVGDTYTITPIKKTSKFASVTVNGTEILGDNKSEVSYTVPNGDSYLLKLAVKFEGLPIKFDPALIRVFNEKLDHVYESGDFVCAGDTINIISNKNTFFKALNVNGEEAIGDVKRIQVKEYNLDADSFKYLVKNLQTDTIRIEPKFTFLLYSNKNVEVKKVFEGKELDMESGFTLEEGMELLMKPVFGPDEFNEIHIYSDLKCTKEITPGATLASGKTSATFTVPGDVDTVCIKAVYPPIRINFPSDIIVERIKGKDAETLSSGDNVQSGDQLKFSTVKDWMFWDLAIRGQRDPKARGKSVYMYTVEENLTELSISAVVTERQIQVVLGPGLSLSDASIDNAAGLAKVGDGIFISPKVFGQVFLSLSLTKKEKKDGKVIEKTEEIENIKGNTGHKHTVVSEDTLLIFKAVLGVNVTFDAATVAVTVSEKAPEEYVAVGSQLVIAPKENGKKFATLQINGKELSDKVKGKEKFVYTIKGDDGEVEIKATVE